MAQIYDQARIVHFNKFPSCQQGGYVVKELNLSVETLRRHDHIKFIEEHFKSTSLAIMYRHEPNPHDEIFQGAFT